MAPNLEKDASSIVVLGKFNPSIFHPSWFSRNGLIKPQEEESAILEVTHPLISIFSIEAFRLQVQPERFVIETHNEIHFELISDLVIGALSILESTPVSSMGVNRMMHFKMDSMEEWHAFGDKIAPKDIWHGILKEPGLLSLTMMHPKEKSDNYIRVKIEPSKKVHPGILIDINNHFTVKDDSTQTTAQVMVGILKETFERILGQSKEMALGLMEKGK